MAAGELVDLREIVLDMRWDDESERSALLIEITLVLPMGRFSRLGQTTAYNSVITACGRAGEWQRALSVLRQMYSYGAVPDVITYNAALAACAEVRPITVATSFPRSWPLWCPRSTCHALMTSRRVTLDYSILS